MSRINFHGPKDVRAIEVQLYQQWPSSFQFSDEQTGLNGLYILEIIITRWYRLNLTTIDSQGLVFPVQTFIMTPAPVIFRAIMEHLSFGKWTTTCLNKKNIIIA